jgi:phosphatidylinositol alpha-1,6-mannosyltransferase
MTAREPTQLTNRIVGLFPELLGVGGVQEAGRLTAAALQEIAFRNGWSTDFLSFNDPPGLHSLDVGGQGISLRGFGRKKLQFLISGIRGTRAFRRGGAHIILAAHPNLAVAAGWMQRASPHLQTVAMAHGVEVWKPLAPFRRRGLMRANLVLAPSRDTVQKLIKMQGVPPEKIRRLPWPLNPNFLRLADASAGLPKPPGFPKQGRIILTVGRWDASERYKGADKLIRAIQQLGTTISGVQLVAVGSGDDLPRLRQLATDLSVRDRVHFLQNLSREEMAGCHAGADFFALPSTGEGFGLVFLEAMAFSKPVVGAACGGVTDIVKDGINGLLVPPDDQVALAQALARLLRDESLCEELGRRGGEIARREYQFVVFQTELEKILGECNSGFREARTARKIL